MKGKQVVDECHKQFLAYTGRDWRTGRQYPKTITEQQFNEGLADISRKLEPVVQPMLWEKFWDIYGTYETYERRAKMTAEEIKKIARRLVDVKLMFPIQDKRTIDEAHNTLMRLAEEEDYRKYDRTF
jgi:hypothetical protein